MYALKRILLASIFSLCIILAQGKNNPVRVTMRDTSDFIIKRGVNIIYYVESSVKGNQYLIPFIESELKRMKDQSDIRKPNLFNSVKSFNFLTSGDKINDTLISTYLTMYKSSVHHDHSKEESEARQRIVEHLKSNQFFLKIDINVLNTLIEYQFVLYRIDNNPTNDFNYIELDNYRTTSVFVNPNNADYKDQLRAGLRELVREANEPPNPSLFLDGKLLTDTVFLPIGNIGLTASASDVDSPNEQLKFSWEVGDPGKVPFRKEGKEFRAFAVSADTTQLRLKVEDGNSDTVSKYSLIIRKKPEIKILRPPKYKDDEFVNNKYILYSYHKTFKFNDFPSIVTYNRGFNFIGDEDFSGWSEIIPEINLTTSVSANDIVFSTIKFVKNGEDSISNYKEKSIPYLRSEYYWQISDESALFNLGYYGKKVFDKPNNDTSKNLNTYKYSVFENDNAKETIQVPSTRYFKISASDHNITNTTDFLVQFRKINRFSLLINGSILEANQSGENYGYALYGIGTEYLLASGISFDGSVGSTTTLNFSSKVFPYYKFGLNFKLISYYNLINLSLMLNDILKKTYTFSADGQYLHDSYYRSRFGVGASLDCGFSRSPYSPVTEEFFFIHYPPGYQLSGFYEAGIRLKIHFAK